MANIFRTPEKGSRKSRLFQIGVETLKSRGWSVAKEPGIGKSSVRRIKKGRQDKLVAIRTTQDRWISFPRNDESTGWGTLCDVDMVVAVSVDDTENPKFALVHMFDQADIKARFDRAHAARIASGRSDPVGHGVWISLYDNETDDPVSLVGAGAGLASPEIARVAMDTGESVRAQPASSSNELTNEAPLTIAEAKRRLALAFGVDPASVKITVEA